MSYKEIKYKRGKPALALTEQQVRYAMQHSDSNAAAARWLNVDFNTYKKYAKMYIDSESGRNLYDFLKHKYASNVAKKLWTKRLTPDDPNIKPMKPIEPAKLEDIYDGKHPSYNRKKLISKMLHAGHIAECCDNCGYNTRREFDLKIPLKIWYRNGDPSDLSRNNIRLICFNCYFLLAYPENDTIGELRKDIICNPNIGII